MDFDLESDFPIFDTLLKKRPEINPDKLRHDLSEYYLPYVKKLVDLKENVSHSVLAGISAIQGTGKTTQGEIMEILLKHFGYTSISRSIDDHYITHEELCVLREREPSYIRRGVTHDIDLAILDLKNLQHMEKPILVSGYDKGVHHGDGDRLRWVNLEEGLELKAKVIEGELMVNKKLQTVRALHLLEVRFAQEEIELPENMGSDIPVYGNFLPDGLNGFLEAHRDEEIEVSLTDDGLVKFRCGDEISISPKSLPNGWRVVKNKPDFIFYDGWMLGVRSIEDDSVFDSELPALETEESRLFAKQINKKLKDYETLWERLDFLTVLYVPNYQMSITWRDQAEEALRQKGEGMTHEEIVEFVHYFWRSVHPAIHIKNLAHDRVHTNQVVIINDDHTEKETLTPDQVKESYP